MGTSNKDLAESAVKPLEKVMQIHKPASSVGGFYEMTHPISVQRCTNFMGDPEHQYRLEIFTPGYTYNVSYDASYFAGPVSMHQQNYFKLVLVISGNFYQIIEGKRVFYTAGSYCLLSPNVRVSENFDSDYQVILITLLPGFIENLKKSVSESIFPNEKKGLGLLIDFMHSYSQVSEEMKAYYDFIPVNGREKEQLELQEHFNLLIATLQNPEIGASYHVQYLICRICNLLENPDNFHKSKINLKTSADLITFSRIAYLLEESSGKISRTELAGLLKFNQFYLSRIVKKYTGMSLSDYRLSFRLEAARDMLENTQLGILDIMRELNCTNRTFFDKIFKEKYGMTPSAYRKRAE